MLSLERIASEKAMYEAHAISARTKREAAALAAQAEREIEALAAQAEREAEECPAGPSRECLWVQALAAALQVMDLKNRTRSLVQIATTQLETEDVAWVRKTIGRDATVQGCQKRSWSRG